MMKTIIPLFLLLIGVSSCYPPTELKDDQIQKLGAKFAEMHSERLLALEKEDIAGAANCYADNAFLFEIGATVKGKKAIELHIAKILNSMSLKNTKNVQKEIEISGNLAYDYGTTSMDLHYTFNGNVESVKSKYIAIWKKQGDGKWKIIKLIFNQEG